MIPFSSNSSTSASIIASCIFSSLAAPSADDPLDSSVLGGSSPDRFFFRCRGETNAFTSRKLSRAPRITSEEPAFPPDLRGFNDSFQFHARFCEEVLVRNSSFCRPFVDIFAQFLWHPNFHLSC